MTHLKWKYNNTVENRDLKKQHMNKNKDKIEAHTFNIRQTKCMAKSIRNDHEGH